MWPHTMPSQAALARRLRGGLLECFDVSHGVLEPQLQVASERPVRQAEQRGGTAFTPRLRRIMNS